MRRLLPLAFFVLTTTARGQGTPTFITSALLTVDDSVGDTTRMSPRLVDAKRLSDGRIVAAVCGSNELRSYDASGRRLSSISLLESPGPQRSLVRLFTAGGDTLAAVEDINTRLTLIGPSFTVLRTVVVPNPDTTTFNGSLRPSRLNVFGRFADGSYIGRITGRPASDSGAHRRPLSLYRFTDGGALLDSITVPGNEDRVVVGARVPQALRLARATSVAVAGDRLIVADQTVHSLVEYESGFKVARRTPTITRPVEVTDSIRDAWTRVAVAREMTPANGVLAVYGAFYADSTAAFRDVVAGSGNRVWVQDPQGADFYPLIWTAYEGGRAVARAELPPRFYPTQFGPDWVLGIATDTLPADRLLLLRLKSGALTNARLSPKASSPANRPRCGAWISR